MSWLWDVLGALALFLFLAGTVLILIYLERKLLGHIQMRLGPMRTGFHGVLQSVADAAKLFLKEDLTPGGAERWVYWIAPAMVFLPAFLMWIAIPGSGGVGFQFMDLGLFYIVAISALSAVGVVLAGWSADNKYALLGSARAAAQMISYEIPIVLVLLGAAAMAGTLNIKGLVEGQSPPYIVLMPLGFVLFLLAGLAEAYRTPFDIPHAESEVVGGPFVEYSGIRWGFFYFAEYIHTFTVAALASLIFLGGWKGPLLPPLAWFFIKTYALVLFIVWLRAAYPRLRIDQLMSLAWKGVIPLAFLNLFLVGFYRLYSLPGWSLSLASLVALGLGGLALYRCKGRKKGKRYAGFAERLGDYPKDLVAASGNRSVSH